MDLASKLTSKGQVTVPKPIRDALDLNEGDPLLFRLENGRAVLAKTPDFLELAGTVEVPSSRRGTAWDEVVKKTRAIRAKERR